MNAKQKRFADEYLIDINATQAAIRAGYSERSAYSQGQALLKNPEVKNYIDKELERLHSERTADAQEIVEYLTSVMRGQQYDEIITMDGKLMEARAHSKERLKAAELLGKRYGLYTDKTIVETIVPVFTGEDKLED